MMRRLELKGDLARGLEFGHRRYVAGYRIRVQRSRGEVAGGCDESRRVNPTRQKYSDGHVGDEVGRDGVANGVTGALAQTGPINRFVTAIDVRVVGKAAARFDAVAVPSGPCAGQK